MNKELLQIMENTRKNYREMHEELVKAYNEAVLEGSSKEAAISFAKSANSVRERYIEVNDNIKKYVDACKNASKNEIDALELMLMMNYAPELINKYKSAVNDLTDDKLIHSDKQGVGDETVSEEAYDEYVKPRHSKATKIGAGILGGAALLGAGYGLSSCISANANKASLEQTEDKNSMDGSFKDASDEEQVNARVDWYFENYFNKEYANENQVVKDSITKENLADIIQVANGVAPEGFEVNEVVNYNNKMTQIFSAYLSTESRTKSGNIGFIPTQYLYEDGSHDQKCAAEVDAVMEKIINAINTNNDEDYKKYAVEFGEVMRDQYYLVDSTSNHYNTRSIASYPARIQLYGMAYAFYTETIMEYGISKGIDICIPFCIDHSTGQTVEIPLSKLMAILDFVPMDQWDAVIQRSGLTVEQIKALGNQGTEDTMPVIFTRDAKNHFRENSLTLSK